MLTALIAFASLTGPKVWVSFIEKGPTPFPDQSQTQTLATNHVANLEAMRISGKLVSAGPTEDPAQKLLGICFFDVPFQRQITEGFTADQMVQRGFLAVRTVRMQIVAGVLHPQSIDPNKTVNAVLAIARRVGTNKKGAFAKHEAFLRSEAVYGGLRFVCRGTSTEPEQEVHLYVDSDPKSVAGLLANDPLVQTGSWRYETYLQKLPKDALASIIE
jgi:uncharacterized protein YciI